MGVTKFVSSAKLAEYLEQEILEALNRRGLYDISRYGWIGDGEQDPEYRGLAVWQDRALALADPVATARLRALGDDFASCMKSGLHSLGLAIVFAGALREEMSLFAEETVGFHCRDAAMKLGLAALDLRDFFVLLHGGGVPVSGAPAGAAEFHAPFAAARAAGSGDARLAPIYEAVDRLAFALAAKRDACECRGPGCTALGRRNEAAFALAVEAAIDDLCEWYELLVAAGNQVFLLFASLAGHEPCPDGNRTAARNG